MALSTLAVVGATGNQGTAVIHEILKTNSLNNLSIRALTRNADSGNSKTLRLQGRDRVHIVEADINVVESLNTALEGADYVFANLNSWLDLEHEVQQGKNIINAAKRHRVKLFIWSTLPSFSAFTHGTYTNVRHSENKFQVQEYLDQSGLTWVGASTAFFASNFLLPGYVSLGEDRTYTISSNILEPDVSLPMTWLEKDLGPFITAVIEAFVTGKPHLPLNQAIVVAGFRASILDLAEELSKQSGRRTQIRTTTDKTLLELDEMMKSFNEYGFYQDQSIPSKFVLENGVGHSTLEEFVREVLLPAVDLPRQ